MLGLVYALTSGASLAKLLINGAAASNNYMDHEKSMYCARNPDNAAVKSYLQTLNDPNATRSERQEAAQAWTKLSLFRPEKYDDYFAKPSSGRVVPRRLDYFSYQELPHFHLTDALKHITVPTVVCCGRHDAQCPVDCSQEIAEKVPGAKLIIFEESNHSPFLEEAGAFAQVVTDFATK
ncbi:hypothetical protein NSQ26_05300 [Bacillus sp. FSL W7-1360]